MYTRKERRRELLFFCYTKAIHFVALLGYFRVYISVPPHKPNIIDEHGTIVQTVTGPYEENEDMKLQCLVSGGEFSQSPKCFFHEN